MVPFIHNLLSVQQWLGDGELAETDWDGDSTMAGILQPISTYRPGTILLSWFNFNSCIDK